MISLDVHARAGSFGELFLFRVYDVLRAIWKIGSA